MTAGVDRGAFLAHADKLHALKVVAESSGLREAASRLGIAPSSLSERLQALEKLFGRPLVARSGARLAVTPFGAELASLAAAPLEALASLAPDRGRSATLKVVRIGAYDSLAVHVLPRLTEDLTQGGDVERLEVRVGRSATLVKSLAAGMVDLAVVIGTPDHVRIDAVTVATDELILVRPRGMAPDQATARIARGAFVGLSPGPDGHPRFYRLFSSHANLTLRPLLTCDSFEVARSVALEAGLPAVLPARVARRGAAPFVALPVSPRATAASHHPIVIARRRAFDGPVFDAIMAKLRHALASAP